MSMSKAMRQMREAESAPPLAYAWKEFVVADSIIGVE